MRKPSIIPCDASEGTYTLRIETAVQNGVETAHIWMADQLDQTVYELELRYPG